MGNVAEPTVRIAQPALPGFLVLGEVGVGKSTLVAQMSGPMGPRAGLNPAGGTKKATGFWCMISHGTTTRTVLLIDSPGIGVKPVNMNLVVTEISHACAGVELHGVILCTKILDNRLTMGAAVSLKILELCIWGFSWEGVILCGTQADRCDSQEMRNFRTNTLEAFNQAARPSDCGSIRSVAVTQVPPTQKQSQGEKIDVQELSRQLLLLEGNPRATMYFRRPDPDDLHRAVMPILGLGAH